MGLHDHGSEDEHDHAHEGEGIVVEKYVWYSLVICAGVYMFYLLELFMSAATCCKHTHSHGFNPESEPPQEQKVQVTNGSAKYIANGKPVGDDDFSFGTKQDLKEERTQTCGLAPVALMVLVGDTVHNLLDGLAIGASFSSSVTMGVSTSIAVLCHEVPHELGDFAILLQTGMPFLRALFLNFVSALAAMVGFYIGAVISKDEDTESWVIAATAGMFLYISLVSMLPDMLKRSSLSKSKVILNNIGMLLGAAIMVLIAVFEEKITI